MLLVGGGEETIPDKEVGDETRKKQFHIKCFPTTLSFKHWTHKLQFSL